MAAVLSFEQRSETAEIYNRAACNDPSRILQIIPLTLYPNHLFYFLLRPAFVVGVVILVLAPTGFHARGLVLAGNLVAC